MLGPIIVILLICGITGSVITVMKTYYAMQEARALEARYREELVPAEKRKDRFDKTSDPFLDWAGQMGLDEVSIERNSAWLQEQYKITRPEAESELDKAIKMIKEVTDGTKAKALTSEAYVPGEEVRGVRKQLSAHRATEQEVRDLPWDHDCTCSPTEVSLTSGEVVRRIHERHCATRQRCSRCGEFGHLECWV